MELSAKCKTKPPAKIPKNNEIITSFEINAKIIDTTGGTKENQPKFTVDPAASLNSPLIENKINAIINKPIITFFFILNSLSI